MRLQSTDSGALVLTTTTTSFENVFRLQDSLSSYYDGRLVTFRDTLTLLNHELYKVYEIESASGSVRGLIYSIENGIMGFYKDQKENYWVRIL